MECGVLKFTSEMLKAGLLRRHKPGAVAREELRIGCGYPVSTALPDA
jgi:hypothetical protein